MRKATELIVRYAARHRDRRNIATHFVAIPLIVFAIGMLLSRPAFAVGGLALTPAWLLWAGATLWYATRGNFVLAAAVSAGIAALLLLAQHAGGASSWLTWGLVTFFVGWLLQWVGHYYEGRKAGFADDLPGVLAGPMFVTAELLFALGWGKDLADEIERRAGPTHLRDCAHPVT